MTSRNLKPISRSMPQAIYEKLDLFRRNKRLTDVVLIPSCPGEDHKELHAHKLILSVYSSYFNAMLNGNLRESKEKYPIIDVCDMNYKTLEIILEFCYTRKIPTVNLTEQEVFDLIQGFFFYQIDTAADECLEVVRRSINPENSAQFFEATLAYKCNDFGKMHKFVCDYMKTNAHKVMNGIDILNFCKDSFINFINTNILSSHEEKFKFAIQWFEHTNTKTNDAPNMRYQFAYEILENIYYHLIPFKFLAQEVNTNDIVNSNKKIKDLVVTAIQYSLLPDSHDYRFKMEKEYPVLKVRDQEYIWNSNTGYTPAGGRKSPRSFKTRRME